MTSSDDLQPSSGVSSPPPDAAESVKILPPPPHLVPQPPVAGKRSGVTIRLLEGLLTVGALALAFLLALLPARNSDVWLHLASGRLLARGQYHFGVDPFAFTTSGVYWVNPSWLYDLLSYYLFQSAGGTALVLAKSVLMALLAWLLIVLSRTTGDREKSGNDWSAAVFAVFALLIVGSSMSLRPICVSYVFLALTLWLLERGLAGDRPTSFASWWPVPLLFALWANLDAWFVLGPVTVGLYFLGSLMAGSPPLNPPPGRGGIKGGARTLGLVFLAGLAACLLNPHHYRILALPSLLPFTTEAIILRDDPFFSRLFLSPFQSDYFRFQDIPHLGRLLYYPLILVGLASFLLDALASRSGDAGARSAYLRRLPVWLFFLALSALDASTIPFMAIAVAPLTALNFREYFHWREAKRSAMLPSSAQWPIAGRIVTLAILLGLLIAAWPGWLQGQLRGPRGWFVEKDSSLVDAVGQVAQWRHEGRLLPTETGFNFSPTAAHYFAYFSSEGERSFCDSRWRLCARAAGDFVKVRRALLGDASALEPARRILRDQSVAYLVLQDNDIQSAAAVFQRLVTAPGEWPILFLQGDTIVFGWRDPARAGEQDRFADRRINFHQRAFHPAEEEKAPARGAVLGPDPSGWRSYWTTASSVSSHARDEAAFYLIYFDMLRPLFLTRHRVTWEHSLAAGIVAAAPGLLDLPRRFLDSAVLLVSRDGPRPRLDGGIWPLDALANHLTINYDMDQDDGPPSLLLLAVRAARRAVNENPTDARAYQLLGEAYLHLSHNTRERAWKNKLSSLIQVRQIQTAVALHRALLLQPDLIQAHTALHALYLDMGLFDLALQQLRHVMRLTQTHLSGESRDSQLAAEVRKREDKFENQAARGSILERAVRALENGLGGKALDILLASDVAVFGKQGTQMELDLLLTVGRIDDVREWMSPSQEAELGSDTYHRLRVKLEAAAGNYDACDEELAQMAATLDRPMRMDFAAQEFSHTAKPRPVRSVEKPPITYRLQVLPRQGIGLKFGQILLDAPGQKQSIAQLVLNRLQAIEFLEQSKAFDSEIRKQAEVEALRGALALERGDVSQAESFLRRAVSIERSEAEGASGDGLNFGGRSAAQGMLDWLSRPQSTLP